MSLQPFNWRVHRRERLCHIFWCSVTRWCQFFPEGIAYLGFYLQLLADKISATPEIPILLGASACQLFPVSNRIAGVLIGLGFL